VTPFFHADADRLLKKEPFFPHRTVFGFRQQVHWVEQELGWLNLPDVDYVIDNVARVKSVRIFIFACLEAKVYKEPSSFRLSLTYSVANCPLIIKKAYRRSLS
jgi:hypothetical protein